jgi:hypothetical protein
MIRGWANARAGQIGAGLRISGHPRIDIVSVVNREDESEDRAIVRLHMRIHRDPKASANEPGDGTILAQRVVQIEDRWTLARHGDSWMLASVSGDPISGELISSPLIASPVEDDERVREAALRELAGREAIPSSELAPMIDPGLSPPEQLRELASADDRFSTELLEAELHHIVQAWEARSDGSERPLERVASQQAIGALIRSGGGASNRLIRDAELVDWKVVEVDLGSRPPHVRVRVQIEAAVFGTAHGHAAGSDTQRTKHALVWELTLDPAAQCDAVWQLTESQDA